MENKQPVNKQKQPTKKMSFMYLLTMILIIFSLVIIFSSNNSAESLTYTEFQQLVYNGEVAEISVEGSTIYVRLVDGVSEDEFPSEMDYYVTYINSTELVSFIDTYNAAFLDDPDTYGQMIIADYYFESEGWIETIWPYLSMLGIIIFAVLIFKMFTGQAKGGMIFGKSKAKMVISSNVKFADVAGADEEKQELKEIVDFMKKPAKFLELGAKIPKGVLLVGNPGTGKTLLAKAVAGESKVPFFSISGSDFVEMYVGVGASRVRDLFDQAKKSAPCIIFIDEIDAVGRQRGAGMGGGNDEREQTLNQLLVEMDGFEGNEGIIVLAATNRSDVLDPALLRPGRFDRQIYVHIPDVVGREAIIKIHAKNKPIDAEVDFSRLARLTSGFAGADIANLLNEAAILAARDDRDMITMVDITEGINKVLMGPQKKSRAITKEDKYITAVHESGHAICSFVCPKCDKVQEISIVPRGNAGGYTLTLGEDDQMYISKQKLLDNLIMMLGGRAAEELILKDVTTGASNDMQRATRMARKMITEWGMSAELGLVSFSNESEIFVGRDYQKQLSYSDQMASKIDLEIKKMIDFAYEKAKEIISKNIQILENCVFLLEKRETIYGEEFNKLFEGEAVDVILEQIDKKEKIRIKDMKIRKAKSKVDKEIKELKIQIETTAQLFKAGVIGQKDFDTKRIDLEEKLSKAENKKEIAKESEETENVKSVTTENEINTETDKNQVNTETDEKQAEKLKKTKEEDEK